MDISYCNVYVILFIFHIYDACYHVLSVVSFNNVYRFSLFFVTMHPHHQKPTAPRCNICIIFYCSMYWGSSTINCTTCTAADMWHFYSSSLTGIILVVLVFFIFTIIYMCHYFQVETAGYCGLTLYSLPNHSQTLFSPPQDWLFIYLLSIQHAISKAMKLLYFVFWGLCWRPTQSSSPYHVA